jgi:hypothetical protein
MVESTIPSFLTDYPNGPPEQPELIILAESDEEMGEEYDDDLDLFSGEIQNNYLDAAMEESIVLYSSLRGAIKPGKISKKSSLRKHKKYHRRDKFGEPIKWG